MLLASCGRTGFGAAEHALVGEPAQCAEHIQQSVTAPPLPTPSFTGVARYACDCRPGAAPGCVPGDDANDGLSPETAVRTAEALHATFAWDGQCGDAYLFCRGGAFELPARDWNHDHDCGSNPLWITAYTPPSGSPTAPAPLLVRSDDDHGVYLSGSPNSSSGYVLEDLHLRCDGCDRSNLNSGIFLIGDISDVLIRRVEVERFSWGVHVSRLARVTVRDSVIHHNHRLGIIGEAEALRIEDNVFEANGCGGVAPSEPCPWGPEINVSDDGEGGLVVARNLFDASEEVGRCDGEAMKAGGLGAVITDNIVRGAGCVGMVIPNTAIGALVSRNHIDNATQALYVDGRASGRIENNVVRAGELTAAPCAGLNVGGSVAPGAPERLQIRNNSIFIELGSAACSGLWTGGAQATQVLVNNVVHYPGDDSRFTCMRTSGDPVFDVFDNNLCFAPFVPEPSWIRYRGNRMSLSEWRLASGLEARSLRLEVDFDHGPPPGPCQPPSNSPLIDAGDTVNCPPDDFTGRSRFAGAACDAGAYEY